MNVVMGFGWVAVALLLGMLLRGKVKWFQKMMAPSCVIGGVIGLLMSNFNLTPGADSALFSAIVAQLFIVSFISIGLTTASKTGEKVGKNILRGSVGFSMVWNLLYALTPVIAVLVLFAIGKMFGMDPIYGLLVPFAFAQGPGQSVTYGTILESYGVADAAMVAVTFAAAGFLFAFLVGVPITRLGIRRGLAKHSGAITESSLVGVIPAAEQKEPIGTTTCHNSNIDPLSYHLALTLATYVLTYGFTWVLAKVTGSADLTWGMMFVNGLAMAYVVNFVMKKCGLTYLHDNDTQKRITGFCTDFLVVASFMVVKVTVIGKWIVPILIICFVTAAVTYFICYYFGRRFGLENDFERFLGLWGTATGTVPSGLALVRIADPEFRTTTNVELGLWNIPSMLAYLTVVVVLMIAAGTLPMTTGLLLLLAPIPLYLILIKVLKLWNKPTFSFKKAKEEIK